MTKSQNRTLNAFMIGIVGLIITIVLIVFNADIVWIKLIVWPSVLICCVSTILSVLNPIK